MEKDLLVYLVPIVLVVGTALGTGLVSGDVTAESDVEVEVEYVAPEIEITDYPDFVGWQDDVYVEAEVTAPGHEHVVDEVVLEFNYTGEKDAGEAYTYAYKSDLQPEDWEEGVGVVDHKWSLEDDEMWRTECDAEWKIKATVYGTEGDYDYDEKTTNVELYRKINWADDGETSGSPGQNLHGSDFENEDGDHPKINITTNDNWELKLTNGKAIHEDEGDDYTLYVGGDYGQDEGAPVFYKEIKINYDVEIPYGYISGSYSTAYEVDGQKGESVHHKLNTFCQPIDPDNQTAWGGDFPGEGPGWWYYYDTEGDEEQDITAAQYKNAGTVTVSETEDEKVTIDISLDGWTLQDVDEPVKIQGYDEGDLPGRRPAPGRFDTYKGEYLNIEVDSYRYFAIHLDLQSNQK